MLTGVPQKERWWLWAMLLWVILSLGPGLMLASFPVFIGPFPLLYVWSLAMYGFSLVLIYLLVYKISFHNVSEDIISEEDELQQTPGGSHE